MSMQKFGIGQPVRRVEDKRFLVGAGRFVDYLELARQCHGVVLYSPHAHALIRGIRTEKASAAPGVLCILTGAVLDALSSLGVKHIEMPCTPEGVWRAIPGARK